MSQEAIPQEARFQIKAALALICWSRLAFWDTDTLTLCPIAMKTYECTPQGHQGLHQHFGRLISWIAFSVGAEYLAKGVCLAKSTLKVGNPKKLRPPVPNSDISQWIGSVLANSPDVKETCLDYGTLGALLHVSNSSYSQSKLGQLFTDNSVQRDLVIASYKLLKDIRDRDVHNYTMNVRSFHFHAVEDLFLPAFNELLSLLDPAELRSLADL
ncbi:MAG: hypothetical protein KKA73_11675 [Chloroflexi bacterium]|nr:hypothetical protein [Chloroflexota bacterium]MBU1748338.1 hypothetical protein [Chloroflexota bacterium]